MIFRSPYPDVEVPGVALHRFVLEVVDAIPRSPSGKILRRVLREHERAVRT